VQIAVIQLPVCGDCCPTAEPFVERGLEKQETARDEWKISVVPSVGTVQLLIAALNVAIDKYQLHCRLPTFTSSKLGLTTRF